ncbi:MAG TPA: PEP-CTERM sorting domain-containing protein [Burkholderiaceae bacterium]
MKFSPVLSTLAAAAAVLISAPAFALTDANSANNCQLSILSPTADACAGTFAGNNVGNANPGADEVAAYIFTKWGVTDNTPYTLNSPVDASAAAGFQVNLGGLYGGDFVVALKQANGFSLYFYDNQEPTQYLTFTTNIGFGGNGNLGLSHFTVYGSTVPAVPEPETYALMLAGLGAMGFIARRRKQQA